VCEGMPARILAALPEVVWSQGQGPDVRLERGDWGDGEAELVDS